MDASIIEAPSTTKNRTGERDSETHQTKKGNQWRAFVDGTSVYGASVEARFTGYCPKGRPFPRRHLNLVLHFLYEISMKLANPGAQILISLMLPEYPRIGIICKLRSVPLSIHYRRTASRQFWRAPCHRSLMESPSSTSLGGVVKRVYSRPSRPGVGRRPSKTPFSWHSGLLPRATA